MEIKKMPFFIKFKRAIFNFDAYRDFLEERTLDTIKYILKLVFIFSLILSIVLTCKIIQEFNNIISNLKEECPQFSFKDNILEIEGNNNKIIKGDESGFFGFIVDSEKENLTDIPEAGNYQRLIAVLKDKMVIRDVNSIETVSRYEQLGQQYDLESINRDTIFQYFSRK